MTSLKRNYSLTGPDTQAAIEKGLAEADWYQYPVPRKRLKELMQRRNGPALRDAILWFAAIGLSGYLGYHFWGTWAAVPCFFIYGLLYGGSSDSRWHEHGHRTAFKTVWMNDVMYYIASFMVMREPTVWRWSHTRHHSDTIIVGRDPEIASPRPPNFFNLFLSLFALKGGLIHYGKLIRHSFGKLDADEATFIPESERRGVYVTARVFVLIYLLTIGAAIATRSILPLMYIGLPSFYGAWLVIYFGLTQHAGLAEDVLDHRLNCRTVYMNPLLRFLYLNMNYHLEHHMFPLVPYHALPLLHKEILPGSPPPYHGVIEAYREIIPALIKQRKDPYYYVQRPLPGETEMESVAAPETVAMAIAN